MSKSRGKKVLKGFIVVASAVVLLTAGAVVGIGAFLTATGLSSKEAEKMIEKEKHRIRKEFATLGRKIAEEA